MLLAQRGMQTRPCWRCDVDAREQAQESVAHVEDVAADDAAAPPCGQILLTSRFEVDVTNVAHLGGQPGQVAGVCKYFELSE